MKEKCPECGSEVISAGPGGGVKYSNEKCDWWFCY